MYKKAEINLFKDLVYKAWKQNEGPFENIFRIATYAMPFVPGLGWMSFAIDKLASLALGLGFEDFGAWIDRELNLMPGSEINESKFVSLEKKLKERMDKRSGTIHSGGKIIKTAFIGALFKTFGIGKILSKAFGIIKGILGFLLVTFSASNMDELYYKIEEYATAKLTEAAQKAVENKIFNPFDIK